VVRRPGVAASADLIRAARLGRPGGLEKNSRVSAAGQCCQSRAEERAVGVLREGRFLSCNSVVIERNLYLTSPESPGK
jgi:hypothetical protein